MLFLYRYARIISAIDTLWKANFNKSLILSQIIYPALIYAMRCSRYEIPYCYASSIGKKPSLASPCIVVVK